MPSEPSSQHYVSNRLTLHYVDWGNADAPPLLLIHGGRDNARNWDFVAARFKDDYHVMAVDLRGHGDSEWCLGGSYHVDDFVFDISSLIRQKSLAPLTIIGHSLGGVISLRYTGIFPENVVKLVAIEGLGLGRRRNAPVGDSVPAPTRFRRYLEGMHDIETWSRRSYPDIEAALARMREAHPQLSAEVARHLTEHGTRLLDDGTVTWKFDHYFFSRFIAPNPLDSREAAEIWANIACPTLLIRGGDSWAGDPEEDGNLAHFRNARAVTVPGAGHWVHHDQLDALTALVREFLSE